MKKCSFTLNNYIFHLPPRIMDPYSIFITDLPKNLTYGQIKGAFWPFQPTPQLQILKKEKYLIVTFANKETVQEVLKERDSIMLKGKTVTIKQAQKKFIPTKVHLLPSFFLPVELLYPLPPPLLLLPTPPLAPAPALAYHHPFPEGFSYFYFK